MKRRKHRWALVLFEGRTVIGVTRPLQVLLLSKSNRHGMWSAESNRLMFHTAVHTWKKNYLNLLQYRNHITEALTPENKPPLISLASMAYQMLCWLQRIDQLVCRRSSENSGNNTNVQPSSSNIYLKTCADLLAIQEFQIPRVPKDITRTKPPRTPILTHIPVLHQVRYKEWERRPPSMNASLKFCVVCS